MTKTLGNGVTTAYQYDDSGALTRMAHAGLAGSRSLAYTYQYDKNGNRTKISLADSTGTMSSDTAYWYDALNRLGSEVRTGGSANYTKYYYFDSVGNRGTLLEFAGPPGPPTVTSYAYNAGEQLTGLTKSRSGVVSENRSYSYDAAGQMTRVADTAAQVTKTFAWDHLGRMTHAEVNNGGVTKSVDYANNPAGKRFMRVAGGVTKAWTYQGDNIASVESTTSPTLHSVYSGSGLGGVAERHDVDTAGGGSTTSRFYLYNHRGDVIGVSDASGALTSAYDYDAYGAVSQSAQSGGGSAPTDDILFTGKDLDPDTGLYYFNARWYDSESGRFVSRTGLAPSREAPYEFCIGDPIGRVDLDGWESEDMDDGVDANYAIITDIGGWGHKQIAFPYGDGSMSYVFDFMPDKVPTIYGPGTVSMSTKKTCDIHDYYGDDGKLQESGVWHSAGPLGTVPAITWAKSQVGPQTYNCLFWNCWSFANRAAYYARNVPLDRIFQGIANGQAGGTGD